MSVEALIREMMALGSAENREGARRFGIAPQGAFFGVSIPDLRRLAKPHRRDHALAQALWETGVQDARILAGYIDDPAQVSRAQMNRWVKDFDNWALCDQVCGNLFDRTPHADAAARAWILREEAFVRRSGFVLMATQAVHRKELPDEAFLAYLPLIRAGATDDRNFVRKAVNWALRQIGKRSPTLRRAAIAEAKAIARIDSKAARGIAADALRELQRR